MIYHHFCHMLLVTKTNLGTRWEGITQAGAYQWVETTEGASWSLASVVEDKLSWAMKPISSSRCSLYSWEPLQSLWRGRSQNDEWLTDLTPMFKLPQELLIQGKMGLVLVRWGKGENGSKEHLFNWDLPLYLFQKLWMQNIPSSSFIHNCIKKRVFYLKIVKPTPVSSKQATPAGDTDLPTSKVGLFDLEPKKREWRV